MKFFTEREGVYIENDNVFRDGKVLEKKEYMFYCSYISNFNLIQKKRNF